MALKVKKPKKPKKQPTTAALKNRAIKVFNAWIRKRDLGDPCISCGKFTVLQAGHFYSAGKYSCMRFDENNVHGQCLRCNYFMSGNLIEYRKRLERKIGSHQLEALDFLSVKCKRENFKPTRFYYLEIIEKYK